MLENYVHRYQARGKYIFAPNAQCNRKGERLLRFFKNYDFPAYFFHYKPGGHVAALHSHLHHGLFFKIDLQNFFYSISRNRAAQALRRAGFKPARTFAKWSSVRNPYNYGPQYVLPIGFMQSPLLASLALIGSPVIDAIEKCMTEGVLITVYFDDFIGSGDNIHAVAAAYERMLTAFEAANLTAAPHKLTPPAAAIRVFNCDLRKGRALVTPERIAAFFSEPRSFSSADSFRHYQDRVAALNL